MATDPETVIRVAGLSKCYTIWHRHRRHDTIRDALVAAARGLLSGGAAGGETEQFWALRDVGFEIKRGEVVGVVGRNGAGKSTLLKVLSRITEPTLGRVEIAGRVASLLEVGTGFHPELTGRENIYLNGAILGMRRAEIRRKFDEIVAFAEVEQFLDTPVKRYSSGMYVRLAFAVAAHLEPEVLIVDEVLAVGDAEFQKKCLGKMSDVAKGGRTILFVSHNMAAVAALCSRAILFNGGRLIEDGPTEEVVERYAAAPVGESAKFEASPYGVRLKSARLAEVGGAPGAPVTMGRDYRLELALDIPAGFGTFLVAVRVFDPYGSLVSEMRTPEEGVSPSSLAGAVDCAFRIPRLPLLPRRYHATVLVHKPFDPVDYLRADDAVTFDVEPAGPPGVSVTYWAHHGVLRLADGAEIAPGGAG